MNGLLARTSPAEPPDPPASLRRDFARAACACLLLLVSTAANAKPSFEWPDFDALSARFPGVGAVCLLDQREAVMADLGGDDFGKREAVTLVIAVLDPTRAGGWLERTVFDSDYHRVTKLEARTWTAPGKSIEVPKSRIFDVASFPDYVLFQDVRGKRFAFPAVAPRTVIELKYNVLARSDYTVEHVFANTIPTLESRATLVVPRAWFAEGFNQIVRAQGLSADPQRETLSSPDGDVIRMTWELQSLPAIPIEHAMPPFADVSPRLTIVPQPPKWENENWSRLGKRYWERLFASRLSKGSVVAALAAKLTEGATTPREKLGRLARFTQGDIRYVASELGIGGYQPHLADEVLKNRYGDCKDKVCLLLSLLAASGIPGEAALVKTAGEGALDTALVDLGQFNHMIARVELPDGVVWVDPTASSCALGYLPGADQATYGLVVSAGRSRLEPTPMTPAEESPLEIALDGTLAPDGKLSGVLSLAGRGEAAIEYRTAFRVRDAEQEKKLVEGILKERLSNARLKSYTMGGLDSLESPFRLAIEFERDGAAMAMDQSLIVLPELVWVPRMEQGFQADARIHPVVLDCLRTYRDRLRIAPPPGFRPEAVAEPSSFNGRYFAFTLDARADGDAVVLDRSVSNRALAVPARAYADAQGELTRLRAAAGAATLRFRKTP
jgi:transglutaminase-like putative cysteine protease